MPYKMNWLEPGRVLYIECIGAFNREDLEAFSADLGAFYDSAPARVHLLVNLHGLTSVTSDALAKREFSLISHPHSGTMFAYGASLLIRSIVNIFNRLTNNSGSQMFATETEARAALMKFLAEDAHTRG